MSGAFQPNLNRPRSLVAPATLLRIGLWAALFPPILYYLTVFGLGPFYGEEYSQVRNTASELGVHGHPSAPFFNASTIVNGILMSIGAIAIGGHSWRVSRERWIGLMLAYASFSTGAASIWAGMFPLPDPRHGMPPAVVGLGMFAIPMLFLIWSFITPASKLKRAWACIAFVLFCYLVAIKSGNLHAGPLRHEGLFQKAFFLTVFPSMALAALHHLDHRSAETPP
jgi:hypothetical membrane protein